MQSSGKFRVPLWVFGLSLVFNIGLGLKIFLSQRTSEPTQDQQGTSSPRHGRPHPFPVPLPGAPTQAQSDVPTTIDPNPMPQPFNPRALPLQPDVNAARTKTLQGEIESEISQIAASRKFPIQGLKLILANKRCIVETTAIGRHATTSERESLRYTIRLWLEDWKMRHTDIKDRPVSVRFADDPAYRFQ